MERKVILTCETASCQNNNIPIEVITDAVEYLCGACMVYINKVEETNGSTEAAE
jgi:hypothetical protein